PLLIGRPRRGHPFRPLASRGDRPPGGRGADREPGARRRPRPPPPRLLVDDGAAHPAGERLLLGPDSGGGDPLRGDLRPQSAGPRHPPRRPAWGPGPDPRRRAPSRSVLLGDRNPLLAPRQRPDLPRLPLDRPRPLLPRGAGAHGGAPPDRRAAGDPQG